MHKNTILVIILPFFPPLLQPSFLPSKRNLIQTLSAPSIFSFKIRTRPDNESSEERKSEATTS